MTDVNGWIKERRRIHRDGWSGTWIWSLGELDKATLTAAGGHVDFDLIRDDEFRGPSEVLDEITDAHNVTVPRALNALEQVLELHVPVETGVSDQYWKEPDYCPTCSEYWPCETRTAIERAIND